MTNSLPWKDPPFLIGKPCINGPFPMATLNNQRVYSFIQTQRYTVIHTDTDLEESHMQNVAGLPDWLMI